MIDDPTTMDTAPLPSDSLLGLIQPYIADELAPAERARVDALLADDPVLRDMVEDQRTIRQDLRDMSPEAAPQALRARVLLELDGVDRERASERPPVAEPGPGPWRRLRALLRGAAVMVPAGATAAALFLAVRTAPAPTTTADAAPTAPIVVGRDNGAVHPLVRLAGASVDEPGPSRPAMRTLDVGDRQILDRQDPAGGLVPGNARDYRGQRFWLGRLAGQPAVAFEADGTRHTLSAAAGPRLRDDLEFMFLLDVGWQLRNQGR